MPYRWNQRGPFLLSMSATTEEKGEDHGGMACISSSTLHPLAVTANHHPGRVASSALARYVRSTPSGVWRVREYLYIVYTDSITYIPSTNSTYGLRIPTPAACKPDRLWSPCTYLRFDLSMVYADYAYLSQGWLARWFQSRYEVSFADGEAVPRPA